jgi:hypothetical protein
LSRLKPTGPDANRLHRYVRGASDDAGSLALLLWGLLGVLS